MNRACGCIDAVCFERKADDETDTHHPALDAIRRVGFDPKPAVTSDGSAASRQGASELHDHEHGDEHSRKNADLGSGIARLILALALATGAESLSFFAPDTVAFKGAGMALALAAIEIGRAHV